MGVIVAGLRHIFTSPITINTFSKILKRRVSGLLKPKSTYFIITTYITPLISIIAIVTTYITPPIAITTISYSIITINIFVNWTRRKLDT